MEEYLVERVSTILTAQTVYMTKSDKHQSKVNAVELSKFLRKVSREQTMSENLQLDLDMIIL